jgi:hypothetical protein
MKAKDDAREGLEIVAASVPKALAVELRESAARHERSVSGEIRLALREHLRSADERGGS